MKIDYITNLRVPSTKANSIQLMQNCEAFKKAGADIDLWAPFRFDTKSEEKIDNIWDYYSVDSKFHIKKVFSIDLFPLRFCERMFFLIQSVSFYFCIGLRFLLKKTDIIYTRDAWIGLALFYKKKKVLELHNYPQRRIGKLIYKLLLKRFWKVIVISEGLKKEVPQAFVAPDGVKVENFDISMTQDDAREKLGIPKSSKIVMYSGSLQVWKGISLLIEAMKNVDAVLYLIGSSLDKKEIVKVPDNVVATGHVPYKNIPFYLKAADVLVIPNTAESVISAKYTSPLKAFEYMASGRPIVVSDLPSMREIFNDGFFKPDDAKDLARAILQAMGKNPERIDMTPYSWDTRVAKIIDFIKQ